jgi:hypothetical protein
MQVGAFPTFESDIKFARELLQEEAVVLLPGALNLTMSRPGHGCIGRNRGALCLRGG